MLSFHNYVYVEMLDDRSADIYCMIAFIFHISTFDFLR